MPIVLTRRAAVFAAALLAVSVRPLVAAETWVEVKSPHFAVLSNTGEGAGRKIAWQLEQIRSVVSTLWPWAKVDLNKPLTVFVVKDEAAMKVLAPSFWERKGGVRPATVWVGGADQNYLAIRADVQADDKLNINPYVSSYFSYVSLILQQSVGRPLPLWLSRGLSGVMSNTIVRESKIMLGPPIPWHLERLRDGLRMKVPDLLKVTTSSPAYSNGESLASFDAEAWALVHFLMFGESSARWPKLDRFSQMVAQGSDPDTAFREALGSPEDLDGPFNTYINRSIFSFRQINVDVAVQREAFAATPVPAARAAGVQALFHVAMQQPDTARRLIEESRKAGSAAEASVAEGLLLEQAGSLDEAKAAFGRAVDAGSTSPYAYYRLASLTWRSQVDRETLARIEKLLDKAVNLNIRYAPAYAMLGEARSQLGMENALSMVLRAIALDPSEPHFHLSAANVLRHERKFDEALKHAQAALELAGTDSERQRARDVVDALTKAKSGGANLP